MEGIPQVLVFDTTFHQTMPEKAFMYGVPYDWYEKDIELKHYMVKLAKIFSTHSRQEANRMEIICS